MRLLKFLQEQNIGNIKEECSYYINFRKQNNCSFFRGGVTNTNIKRITTSIRRPKGTGEDLSNFIEKYFRNHGILDRRSSVCITTNKNRAAKFGSVCEVFPIGKFDYSFCKSIDFNQNAASDPFQIVYFVWLMLKENNLEDFWSDYIINTLTLAPYVTNWKTIVDDIKDQNFAKQAIDFVIKYAGTNIDSVKDPFYINNKDNLEQTLFSNYYMAQFDINKIPKNLQLHFVSCWYDSDSVWGVVPAKTVIGEKHYFTVGELESGSKSMSSLIQTNKGISDAAKNGWEIWINPKEFYLIPIDQVDSILN